MRNLAIFLSALLLGFDRRVLGFIPGSVDKCLVTKLCDILFALVEVRFNLSIVDLIFFTCECYTNCE